MSLAQVEAVSIPRACVDEVHAPLRKVGRNGDEGLGLWVGIQAGRRFDVHQAVIPEQRHIRTRDGVCVMIGPDELHRLNVWLFERRLTLLAQVHSHPGRAYHSSTDDEHAVATRTGSLSLVVPDYATRPFDLGAVAAYRLEPDGRWRPVKAAACRKLITIVG